MTTFTPGRLLLVVLAIVGLAFAVPAVSAHGDEPTADDEPPYNASSDERAAWMQAHVTDHMGPGAVDWMEAHMGVTVEEMAEDMADDGTMAGYGDGTMMDDGARGGYGHGTTMHDGTRGGYGGMGGSGSMDGYSGGHC